MAAEVAATLALLVGDGLIMRTFFELYDSARAVDRTGLVATRLILPIQKYRPADQPKDLVGQLGR